MNRTECLETAKTIVNGARQENYGSPESNFRNIAELWTTYFNVSKNTEDWYDITPMDVANMMILMKMARLINKSDHEDSWIDICGYAANGCELSTAVKDSKDWNKFALNCNLGPVEVEEFK